MENKKVKSIIFQELEEKGKPVRKVSPEHGLLMMPPQVRLNYETFLSKGGDPNKWKFKFINIEWSAEA